MRKIIIMWLFFILICLCWVGFVLGDTINGRSQLRKEIFGFKFGMTPGAAFTNSKKNDYKLVAKDYSGYLNPRKIGFKWDFLPKVPKITYKNNDNVVTTSNAVIFYCIKDDSPVENVSLLFGDRKLFEIIRSFKVPGNYDLIDDVFNLFVKKYGKPNNKNCYHINISTKQFAFLWYNKNYAMELVFISRYNGVNWKFEKIVTIRYLCIDIIKDIAIKAENKRDELNKKEFRNFKFEY